MCHSCKLIDRTCARCCAEPQVVWSRGDLRLQLCQHHSSQHGAALMSDGWDARKRIDPATDTKPGGPLLKR